MKSVRPNRASLSGTTAPVWRCAHAILAFLLLLLAANSAEAQTDGLAELFNQALTPSHTGGQPNAVVPPQAAAHPATSEELPLPRLQGQLPLADSGQGQVQLSESRNGLITLIVRDASLSRVLSLLAQEHGLNIVASNDIDAIISITLRDVPIDQALTAILSVANYTWTERNNIIMITSLANSASLPADVQGRQIQVFNLDYASASTVAEAVANFLSPIGKVTISESNPTNNRLTQERVVVEDLPDSLARIAAFICQIDHPPRQVLIEAHVLQVNLDDKTRCGVNFDELLRLGNANLNISTTGFANPDAPQAFLATLSGGDLSGVIEALQTTTDSKSLGSPKILVLNEQQARIQVGQQLGFRVTTTTETSTMEGVQFLDVGVVLTLRPRITRDGRVLLHVKPEVSKGEVNPITGLPEEDTTQLETDIMLEDGQGMVIGGLIQEHDSTVQSKIPYLGNMKGIGWLFRNSEVTKQRAEIIVALVPRIQPYDCEYASYEQGELIRAGVPLFNGPLNRNYRPWEPILPDGKRVYYPIIPPKRENRIPAPNLAEITSEYVIPPTPLPRQHFPAPACQIDEPMPAQNQPQNPFLSDDPVPLPRNTRLRSGEIIFEQN